MSNQLHTRRGDSLIPPAVPPTTSRTEAGDTTVNRPTTEGQPRAKASPRQPGQWPAGCKPPTADVWQRLQAERARRELALAAIQAELDEQPTPRAVRSAGRRWCRLITVLADDIAEHREAA